ncbi:MAG: hypothetical protein GY780_08845 [bacterium]|nr:hypothetical protein [bacterium]
MIATCSHCSAQYKLENDKIPRRIIQVRCPACQGVFAMNGNLADSPDIPVEPEIVTENFPEPEALAPPDPVVTEEPIPVDSPPPFETTSASQDATTVNMDDSFSSEEPEVEIEKPIASPAVATLDIPSIEESGGKRRRRCKEEMLARALVSDILVYNRDTRDAGLAEGKLLEALGGEIKKSWELYKEKVTPEVANSTTYFREALNEILAEGDSVF